MQKTERKLTSLYFRLLMVVIFLPLFFQLAAATDIIEVNSVDVPQGAVILIVDGLSSSYLYPELVPYALDGRTLPKVEAENLSFIMDHSCRVLDVRAPQTYTEAGHSVLVTGYTRALSDSVSGPGTTIYDIAHEYGYYTFAVMQKGDSSAICSKQDVIIHDATNSINEPEMLVRTNIRDLEQKQVSLEVASLMQDSLPSLNEHLSEFPEGSQQRYDIYDNWAVHTAIDVMDHMQASYPGQHYLLTVNVGGVDSAGHYKKDTGYIDSIEGIDASCMELYRKCEENNLAFIFVSDHGMAFPSPDSRGGHQAAKYSGTNEAQRVPFVISASGIESGVIEGSYGQEDIAPTILEVLYLPDELRLSDGKAIPLRDHTVLKVSVPQKGRLELISNGETAYETTADGNILLRGVVTGSSYIIRYSSEDGSIRELEKEFFLEGSQHVDLRTSQAASKSDQFLRNPRHIIGGFLIVVINIAGLLLIRKIMKE